MSQITPMDLNKTLKEVQLKWLEVSIDLKIKEKQAKCKKTKLENEKLKEAEQNLDKKIEEEQNKCKTIKSENDKLKELGRKQKALLELNHSLEEHYSGQFPINTKDACIQTDHNLTKYFNNMKKDIGSIIIQDEVLENENPDKNPANKNLSTVENEMTNLTFEQESGLELSRHKKIESDQNLQENVNSRQNKNMSTIDETIVDAFDWLDLSSEFEEPEKEFEDPLENANLEAAEKVQDKTHLFGKPMQNRDLCNYEGCQYRTKDRTMLVRHERTHTGEKPFLCNFEDCNYRASQKAHLKYHERTHTGEKPFNCDYQDCNYRAAIKTNLENHKRTHTGEKPFKCDYQDCQYKAAQKISLLYHKRSHTGDKPFKCDYEHCHFRSAFKSSLKNHERTHTGEKPF